MVAEFPLQCDGCHVTFKEGNAAREPVSVGCFHTLCRACAEGDNGAYGVLQGLASEVGSDGEHVDQEDVDTRVKGLVRGRCGVCGGGKGSEGEIVVRDVVVEALRGGEDEEDENGQPERDSMLCAICNEGSEHVATHFCEECDKHMCANMARGHKHAVKRAYSLLCPTHQQPFEKMYCQDHKCLVCTECLATTHRGHTCTKVGAKLARSLKKSLRAEIGRADAKRTELEGAEAELVEARDEMTASTRRAIASIDAVFRELERKKEELIGEAIKARKDTCQRLNDVRTTSRLLGQGVEAAQRSMHALGASQSIRTIQRAGATELQLHELVDVCSQVKAQEGKEMPASLQHSEPKLHEWLQSLAIHYVVPSAKAIQRGYAHFVQRQRVEALAEFEKCESDCVALGYRAIVLLEVGGGVDENEGAVKRLANAAVAGGLQAKAASGDHHAQLLLATFHEGGLAVPKDTNKAVELLTQSADQGNAVALCNLGVHYAELRDEGKATVMFAKAGDQGHAEAQFNLGVCFQQGKGVAKNMTKAAEQFRKAADQGHAIAQFNLGICFDRGDGVSKDVTMAAKMYAKAAEQGHTDAQYSLGMCFLCGEGVAKSEWEGVAMLSKAADQGHKDAQFNLGMCYQRANGVKKNEARGVELFHLAAAQGHVEAQFFLGLCLLKGAGVPRNEMMAMGMLLRAASQGHQGARGILAKLGK